MIRNNLLFVLICFCITSSISAMDYHMDIPEGWNAQAFAEQNPELESAAFDKYWALEQLIKANDGRVSYRIKEEFSNAKDVLIMLGHKSYVERKPALPLRQEREANRPAFVRPNNGRNVQRRFDFNDYDTSSYATSSSGSADTE